MKRSFLNPTSELTNTKVSLSWLQLLADKSITRIAILEGNGVTRDDYLTLLRQALASPHGVTLQFGNWEQAERARARFYRLRNSLRRSGDRQFDGLSFYLPAHVDDLWIVRRDRLPRRDGEDGFPMKTRELGREELPDHFGYSNYSFKVSKPKK